MFVLIAALEIYSEENIRESVVGTFKNICTVAVHCWYMIDVFAGFCQQILKKKELEVILGKIGKNLLSFLADFGYYIMLNEVLKSCKKWYLLIQKLMRKKK